MSSRSAPAAATGSHRLSFHHGEVGSHSTMVDAVAAAAQARAPNPSKRQLRKHAAQQAAEPSTDFLLPKRRLLPSDFPTMAAAASPKATQKIAADTRLGCEPKKTHKISTPKLV